MRVLLISALCFCSSICIAGQFKRQSSDSMLPAIAKGDVFELDTASVAPARGDIVSYTDGRYSFVSRVLALAGDRFEIRAGTLLVNGMPVSVKGVPAGNDGKDMRAFTVPPDTVFVVGDNRSKSNDSRFKGPISMKSVQGTVTRVLHPAPAYMDSPSPPACLNLNKPFSDNFEEVYAWLAHSETAKPVLEKFREALSKGRVKLVQVDEKVLKGSRIAAFYLGQNHTVYFKKGAVLGAFALIFIHEALHATDKNMSAAQAVFDEDKKRVSSFLRENLTPQQLDDFKAAASRRASATELNALLGKSLSPAARQKYAALDAATRANQSKMKALMMASERGAYDFQYKVSQELVKAYPCYDNLLTWLEINARLWRHKPSDAELEREYGHPVDGSGSKAR